MSSAHFGPLYPRYCGIHGTPFSSSGRFALNRLWGYFMDCWFHLVFGDVISDRRSILVSWFQTFENFTEKQIRYLKDGLGKSIVNHYSIAQGDGDQKMVISVFSLLALGDKNKFLKFAASIPRDRVLNLIPPIVSNFILREPLTILLRSCAASTGATGSDEDVRKRSLLVCLDAIHHIVKAPIIPDLVFVRLNFANVGLMRALWHYSDTTIRVISRTICALIAKQVLRINQLREPELRWLQEVTGEISNGISTLRLPRRTG
jgi:hypothetical protein